MSKRRIFIGWDPRDDQAYKAAVSSLHAFASCDLEIIGLRDLDLRRLGLYWRPYSVEQSGQMVDHTDGRPFSTQFAFTRFLVPELVRRYWPAEIGAWHLFLDADVLVRADIEDLFAFCEADLGDRFDLAVVQHDHRPPELEKMGGLSQAIYARKNWSSVMMMRPIGCPRLTPDLVNRESGRNLHALTWIDDARIAALPSAWNWLEGWSPAGLPPSILHYTRGTPDLLCGPLPMAEAWRAALASYSPDLEVRLCDRAI
jgi:hypothetical protein